MQRGVGYTFWKMFVALTSYLFRKMVSPFTFSQIIESQSLFNLVGQLDDACDNDVD